MLDPGDGEECGGSTYAKNLRHHSLADRREKASLRSEKRLNSRADSPVVGTSPSRIESPRAAPSDKEDESDDGVAEKISRFLTDARERERRHVASLLVKDPAPRTAEEGRGVKEGTLSGEMG